LLTNGRVSTLIYVTYKINPYNYKHMFIKLSVFKPFFIFFIFYTDILVIWKSKIYVGYL
jgi:hypothetical protein